MAFARRAERAIGHVLERIALGLAYGGGLILVGMALVTVVSIIGRALLWAGLGPIRGDFELVETGCAIAVFFFLPLAQMRRGHVTVDVFIQRLPMRLQEGLGVVGDTLIAIISYVILWRLWLGFGEKFPYGSDGTRAALGMGYKPFYPETTYELELPVWIPFGLSVIGALLFFAVSVFTVWRGVNRVLAGREERV